MTQNLEHKKIIVAITGGIAAYKINHLVRLLVKHGAQVQVLLTPSATDFVSRLTLATLSKRPVLCELYNAQGDWTNHIDLALWADAMLIAPCTANTLAKAVHGQADNLLLTTYLSAKCPVFIAPAMDLDMYQHPSTKANLAKAQSYGHHIIPAESGELASGLHGEGRMAEPETILSYLADFLSPIPQDLLGQQVLISAGPTYEPIDPVRFIGNHSSGKMGYALAKAAAQRGAKVTLVSGPCHLPLPHPEVDLHQVQSAKEMQICMEKFYPHCHLAIMSAAVADYTPKIVATEKIKKSDDEWQITMHKNPDILLGLGQQKQHQFLIGFALETQNEIENAKLKLKKKNLDFIVLNSLKDAGAGFGQNTNLISIIEPNENITTFELKSKDLVAHDILNHWQNIVKSSK
jgi:phosphopantothenoylcysteine decarboxylase / phosphopantothenate---cysteine ligase